MSTLVTNAQDLIILNNAEEIAAKVTEVGTDEVTYKKFNNLEGPVYKIAKSSIFMIKYENGFKEVYTNYTQPVIVNIQPPELTFANHTFRLGRKLIDYQEVNEIMKECKKPEVYKTFNIAYTQQKFSKPARVLGLIVGITGTIIAAQVVAATSDNSVNSSDDAEFTAVAATTSIALIGWSTYVYSIVLKRKASEGFTKSAAMYNAAF